MSEEHKLGIIVGKDSVELTVGQSVFKLGLDECGLPEFPESGKEQLPPYVPEMV